MAAKKPALSPVELAEGTAPEPMVRIRALTPVRHDGQDYSPEHQVLEVNASAAHALVAQGLAALVRTDPAELSLA